MDIKKYLGSFRDWCVNTAKKIKIGILTAWTGVKEWCKENPEEAKRLAFSIGVAGLWHAKSFAKAAIKEHKENSDLSIYDFVNHHPVPIRRKLTVDEWKEYDYRFKRGEDTRAILEDMRLLKK